MLSVARRWALSFPIFAIVAIGPVAAFAGVAFPLDGIHDGGVDTPPGVHELPFGVEGKLMLDLNDSTVLQR